MKRFAILRHAKIKPGRHLVGVGLHNARGAPTPNADGTAMPIEILIGTDRPHRDVMNALEARGITKLRKGANVAVEIFTGASPEWWASKGWVPGIKAEGELLDLLNDWKSAQVDYLRELYGDRLVNLALHPDEASPHVQALVIPVHWGKDGREKAGVEAWRLSTEKMLKGPRHLKAIQTDYARRMGRFGLERGEDRETGTTWHRPLKDWQAQQRALARKLGDEIVKQLAITAEAEAEAQRIRQDAHAYAEKVRRKAEEDDRTIAIQKEMKRRADEDAAGRDRHDAAVAHSQAEEARRDAERIRAEAEEERAKARRMVARLQKMFVEFDRCMKPIRSMAAKFLAASPLIRQAIGAKGPEAVNMVESDEVARIEQMQRFLGKGPGGRG